MYGQKYLRAARELRALLIGATLDISIFAKEKNEGPSYL